VRLSYVRFHVADERRSLPQRYEKGNRVRPLKIAILEESLEVEPALVPRARRTVKHFCAQ
jgi:hypothetical protein